MPPWILPQVDVHTPSSDHSLLILKLPFKVIQIHQYYTMDLSYHQ